MYNSGEILKVSKNYISLFQNARLQLFQAVKTFLH